MFSSVPAAKREAAEREDSYTCGETVFDSCAMLCCEPAASCRPASCGLVVLYLIVIAWATHGVISTALSTGHHERSDSRTNSNQPLGKARREFASAPQQVDVVYMWGQA